MVVPATHVPALAFATGFPASSNRVVTGGTVSTIPSSHVFELRFFADLRFAYRQEKYDFEAGGGGAEVDAAAPGGALRFGAAKAGRVGGRAGGAAPAPPGLTKGDLNPAEGFTPPGGRKPAPRITGRGLNAAGGPRGGFEFAPAREGDNGARGGSAAGAATPSSPPASSGAARFISRAARSDDTVPKTKNETRNVGTLSKIESVARLAAAS
jgi:hypothetical protein